MVRSLCQHRDQRSCSSEDRYLKCQWANGKKRQFCRKASATTIRKRSVLRINVEDNTKRQERASKKIAAAFKRSMKRKRKSPQSGATQRSSSKSFPRKVLIDDEDDEETFMTPVSEHYKTISERRGQYSILEFRNRCKLFPHPVELLSPSGIFIPIDRNYAVDVMKYGWKEVLDKIVRYLPPLKAWQKINIDPDMKRDKHLVDLVRLDKGDVIIGIKLVKNLTTNRSHVVFYEVRVENKMIVTVVDPNGSTSDEHRVELKRFFEGMDTEYVPLSTFNINTSDDKSKAILEKLGFEDDFSMGGYCSVIACFFLVDYVCTNQWVKSDPEHFVRASREWLFDTDSNFTEGRFYLRTMMRLRTILFARYIAYHFALQLGWRDVHKSKLENFRIYEEHKGDTINCIQAGTKKFTIKPIEGVKKIHARDHEKILMNQLLE